MVFLDDSALPTQSQRVLRQSFDHYQIERISMGNWMFDSKTDWFDYASSECHISRVTHLLAFISSSVRFLNNRTGPVELGFCPRAKEGPTIVRLSQIRSPTGDFNRDSLLYMRVVLFWISSLGSVENDPKWSAICSHISRSTIGRRSRIENEATISNGDPLSNSLGFEFSWSTVLETHFPFALDSLSKIGFLEIEIFQR
jgi:hypothetical protein